MKKIISFVISFVLICFVFVFYGNIVNAHSKEYEIRAAYRDMLNREPTSKELSLEKKYFVSYRFLLNKLNKTPERDEAIINIYQRALKRRPRSDELATLKKFVAPNNLIRKQLYTSKERELAIRDLYQGLLGRQPRLSALEFYIKTRSPFYKIKEVLNQSKERKLAIKKKYQERLFRDPTQKELTSFIKGFFYLDLIGKMPIAYAGEDKIVNADTLEVILDASNSLLFNNNNVLYNWTIISSPNNTIKYKTYSFSSPLFSLNLVKDEGFDKYALAGVYRVMLIIQTDLGLSKSDEIKITVLPYTKGEESLLEKINQMRREGDLKDLTFNQKLLRVSRKYAKYLLENDWFDHKDKQGKSVADRVLVEDYQYTIVGENLGVIKSNIDDLKIGGEKENEFFATYWRKSPLHYKNIMTKDFEDTGIGFALGKTNDAKFPYKLFVVQVFGKEMP